MQVEGTFKKKKDLKKIYLGEREHVSGGRGSRGGGREREREIESQALPPQTEKFLWGDGSVVAFFSLALYTLPLRTCIPSSLQS